MRNTRTITLYKGFTLSINLYLAFSSTSSMASPSVYAGDGLAGPPGTLDSRGNLLAPHATLPIYGKRTPDRPRYACMLFTIAPVVNYM